VHEPREWGPLPSLLLSVIGTVVGVVTRLWLGYALVQAIGAVGWQRSPISRVGNHPPRRKGLTSPRTGFTLE